MHTRLTKDTYQSIIRIDHSEHLFPNGMVTSDGKYIVSVCVGVESKILLWDIQSGEIVRTFSNPLPNPFVGLTMKGKYIVAMGSHDIALLHIENPKKSELFKFQKDVSSFSWQILIDESQIIIGNYNGMVVVLDIETGKEIHAFKVSEKSIKPLTVTADKKYVLLEDSNGMVIVLDKQSGEQKRTLQGHSCFTLTPDGAKIVAGTDNGEIKLLNIEQGKAVHQLEGHGDRGVVQLVVSADGKYLLSGDADGRITMWDMQNDNMIHTLQGYNSSVKLLAFTADKKYIVSVYDDGIMKLWSSENGKVIHTFEGYCCRNISLYSLEDGREVLLGSDTVTLFLWDVKSGKLLSQYTALKETEWASLTPDGHYKCSSGAYKYIYFSENEHCMYWNLIQK